MIAWLTDTLIYSGVLIALVLLLRGPVARHFGPQMSYALWALPFLRFLMPPVVLPASLAPEPAADMLATSAGTGELASLADVAWHPVAGSGGTLPEFSPANTPGLWSDWSGLLADVLIFVWLGGAAAFLLWRWWTYFRMRDWLLAGARPVGEVGRIRLVESPAVKSPVAFGVSDKVIALPMEFMAMEDRAARDLAIGHELAHHRGRDLLANILAQPILALHWFNPLAWLGWRAMRRDQEAACDARVIAGSDPQTRAQYGRVIASFAAGPRLSLAAPMAGHRNFGPLLGEKSIIHRLRSLAMSDVSPRRRLAGRLLLAGAALALPLTASISYAGDSRLLPQPPQPPAPPEAPLAPVPPVPPVAPVPPAPVRAPGNADVHVHVSKNGAKQVYKFTQSNGGDVRSVVLQSDKPLTSQQRAALEDMRRQMATQDWDKFDAEWERKAAQWEKQWEAWGKDLETSLSRTNSVTTVSVAAADYDVGCNDRGRPAAVARATANGVSAQAFTLCRDVAATANASARAALLEARASIARNRSLSREIREEVLESLDQEIEQLDEDI